MRVKVDFDRMYVENQDPWAIGAADSERYDLYRTLLLESARRRGSLLDLGCGFGAFLARFADDFSRLVGVELSPLAVEKGRERHPFIEFHEGSADDPEAIGLGKRRFDAVVFSDVVYYLPEEGRRTALEWIADHLEPDGVALIAAWCPGGDYLTRDELRRLVARDFAVEHERLLDSGHVLFIGRPRMTLVALTVDYETWQPIPPGRRIDWEADIFSPATALLDALDAVGAKLTFFAELGEHIWLEENEPALARRMEAQWADAVRRGHDVQLHLHPTWLPELGARFADGEWIWDWTKGRADDYPGDLTELIARCRERLERAIRPVAPDYRVTAFRAGAYEAQPFARLYDALAANGIVADSSVYWGGTHEERQYDYRLAWSTGQPYYASRYDPQLKAPPAERGVLELPILTFRNGERWSFDDPDCATFGEKLLDHLAESRRREPTSEALRRRAALRRVVGRAYNRLRRYRRGVNRLLPKRVAHMTTAYEREALVQHDYCVLVGHTKTDLDTAAIGEVVRRLMARPRVRFLTLSEMVERSRAELDREAEHASGRNGHAPLRWGDAAERHLRAKMPADAGRVLDLGAVDDPAALPFADGSFDCVYADRRLQLVRDVDAALGEVARVLAPGGVLVAAVSSDARDPAHACPEHTWKTAPHEVRMRLQAAGFADVDVEELDAFRKLGMPPFPPSRDRLMFITARSGVSEPRPPAPARSAAERAHPRSSGGATGGS